MNVLAFGDRAGHHMYGRGDGWFPLGGILAALVLAGLVATAFVLATRAGRRRPEPTGPLAPTTPGFAPTGSLGAHADDALNLVRMRYARGEMSRDEYLQTAADLGGSIVPTPPVAPPAATAPAADVPPDTATEG